MRSQFPPNRFLVIQWAAIAWYSSLTCLVILFYKTLPDQSFYSGISIARLLTITPPLTVFMVALYFIWQSLAQKAGSDLITKYIFSDSAGRSQVQIYAIIAIIFSFLGVCLPAYYFGDYAERYTRIQPLIIWTGIVGLHILILIFSPQRRELYKKFNASRMENSGILRLGFWIFFGFIVLWLLIAKTGTGISGHEDYWYEAGVPILPAQVLISILVGFLFSRVTKPLISEDVLKLDRWVFLVIWLVAASIWAITPAPKSYFNPDPLPPNNEVYPYSDAAGYDLQSQYALMGMGLDNGLSVDNPLYPAFLVFIHLVSGQNYAANMALQAAIFAVFPALTYLIGKALIGRTLGITAAMMMILRGYNSIAIAAMINLASPKQMLTDFPTAIGVALSIFSLLVLFDKENKDSLYALWHGGAIGFTFLIRPTSLVLLGISPLIALFQSFSYQKWLRIVLLTLLGFIIFVLPWGIRNTVGGGNAISIYLRKLDLVKDARFPEVKDDKSNSSSEKTLEQTQITDLDDQKNSPPVQFLTVTGIVLSHFTHNVIGSTLILPTSLVFDDLRHTIKSSNTIWQPFWNGNLTIGQIIILIFCLAILALGIAQSCKKNHVAGLIPLAAFLIYQFSNSIGRSSGGRYIVPVDWIILIYFSAGLTGMFNTTFPMISPRPANHISMTDLASRKMLATFSLILFLGTIPVLSELPFILYNKPIQKEPLLTSANFQDISSKSIYSQEDISVFLGKKNSILITGQAMYPRYLGYQAIKGLAQGGLEGINFPHLEFYLISEKGNHGSVVMFSLSPIPLSNQSKVLVLGCKEKKVNYIDAIAVVTGVAADIVQIREPNPPLECPLPQFKCDNNGKCN